MIIQTDRTIPPNAIMKRRKQKDADGNIIERTDDHREECGGVGSDAVDAPNIVSITSALAILALIYHLNSSKSAICQYVIRGCLC